MLVDLTLRDKVVVVWGDGAPAEARVAAVSAEGARAVRVRSPRTAARTRSGRDPIEAFLRRTRPAIVFSTLDDAPTNRRIATTARRLGALVHVYDAPSLSDFTLPSVGGSGGIHLAVSTSGRSPAMAAVLRRRLEKKIRPEDLLQLRMQGALRPMVLRTVPTFAERRDLIYRLVRDRRILGLLRAGRYREALSTGRKMVRTASRTSRSPGRVTAR